MSTTEAAISELRAYHSDKKVKAGALAIMAKHRKADTLIQGYGYWRDGKGCAVGCLIQSGEHAEYEARFGIPQMLARLEDAIFEGLPQRDAQLWPEQFLAAPKVGADLSRVGWQFLHWLLTDKAVNPGIDHPTVRDAVRQCADVLVPLTKGQPVDESAARSAAWSAESAAIAASAASAASAAESAARSAWSAASAASAAWSAASAASAAWKPMAAKLIALMEAA